jgi:hypothetical protein
MGVSTDGQIGYGVVFEEGYKFPWDKYPSGDIEDWWTEEVLGFKHSFEIYDIDGGYIGGQEPSRERIMMLMARRMTSLTKPSSTPNLISPLHLAQREW